MRGHNQSIYQGEAFFNPFTLVNKLSLPLRGENLPMCPPTFAVDVVVVRQVVGKQEAPKSLLIRIPYKLELLKDAKVGVVLPLTMDTDQLG